MELITQTFKDAFTIEWALWAVPVSLVLSFLANRVTVAPILAVFAMIVQHVGPVILPMLMNGNANGQTMADAVVAAVQKVDPLVAGYEFVAFVFFIAVFTMTRRDMFRERPE